MHRTIVFVNQKGGVGKTTSAINLGAYLATAGKKTLLVDFDPQANLSHGLGITAGPENIYHALLGHIDIEKIIQSSAIPGLDVAPSSIDLSGANVELIALEDRNNFLKHALESVEQRYDFILIDCPPSLGILTLNGLVAASEVLIPLQCEYFALEGLSLILKTIQIVQNGINKDLSICGIFFTMYDSRTRLAQDVVQQVSDYFKDKVFKTIIPRNVRLSEAPSHGLPICQYDQECIGAKSYKALSDELISREAIHA